MCHAFRTRRIPLVESDGDTWMKELASFLDYFGIDLIVRYYIMYVWAYEARLTVRQQVSKGKEKTE